MLQNCSDSLDVLENVGRVGHSQSEHAATGDVMDHFFQQRRQIGADIATICAEIFAGEPDFNTILLESLIDSIDNLRYRIAAQIPSSVFRLAIRARIQAARIDWKNLNKWVLSDLWEIQFSSSQRFTAFSFLAIKLDGVS